MHPNLSPRQPTRCGAHPRRVTRRTTFQLLRTDRPHPTPVVGIFAWSDTDPFEVRLTLLPGRRGVVTWYLSRDLLAEALRGPVGQGDVRVKPDVAGFLLLTLTSPDGCAVFRVARRALREFLAGTFAVVPVGTEVYPIDPDTWLRGVAA